MICVKLKRTNEYGETYWFVSLGDPWPSKPECRLIRRTTADKDKAHCFASAAEAAETLVLANNPTGWEIDVEDKP